VGHAQTFDQFRALRIPRAAKATSIAPTPKKEEDSVSVLIRFSPPSLTAGQYDSAVRRLTEEGVLPAEGLDYEICYGPEGQLKVSQVWDTQEQLEAFGARLQPILSELGINPGEPEFLEVHNVFHRGEPS
jgi:hypothetical protein